VPAAAVIPALMVYANIVAVKKLLVEYVRESFLCDLIQLPRNSIIPIIEDARLEFIFQSLK
tara:strand:- start:1414 stop:1596 length:183 start_codon:yes stop_codon:yes gene_type:complete